MAHRKRASFATTQAIEDVWDGAGFKAEGLSWEGCAEAAVVDVVEGSEAQRVSPQFQKNLDIPDGNRRSAAQ